VGFQVRRKNKLPQFILRSLTLRASIVLDAHEGGMFHVIRQPRRENWPATAHFAVGTRPQSTGIDVSSLGKSRDRLQHYLGDITQHLLVYISLGSVIGCGIPLEFVRHREESKHNLREVAVCVPYRGMDIPNGQVDRPGFLGAGEVRELRLVRFTDQWNNCCPRRKCIQCLPPPVCRIHLGIHLITLRVYGPGWSIDHVVFIWALAKEVPHTFYWVSKIEKPPTVWCGDGSFSPFRQLDIHRVDLIVHGPSGGVGKVLGNLASTFVEVAINL